MALIYLDNSATTKPSETALKTYLEVSSEHFGNPSSLHSVGRDAERYLTDARKTLLATIGDRDGSVVFTASGTEANNLAIFGRVEAKERFQKKKILTTAGEHASVGVPLAELGKRGFEIVEIPTVGGKLDLDALARAADRSVVLATMMLVNNETGAIYDLAAAARILKAASPDAVLHADATQAYLKMPINIRALGVSLLTVSSHKIEGPKGVGALWIDRALIKNQGIAPFVFGGGQESGLRSGTENVPGIAAFAAAAKEGHAELALRLARLASLSSTLTERLTSDPRLSELKLNLSERKAPHIFSITLPSIKSETMLHALSSRGIYVSSGSACSSHGRHSTPALAAYGLSDREADSTIRVSLSHRTTEHELHALCDALGDLLPTLVRTK